MSCVGFFIRYSLKNAFIKQGFIKLMNKVMVIMLQNVYFLNKHTALLFFIR